MFSVLGFGKLLGFLVDLYDVIVSSSTSSACRHLYLSFDRNVMHIHGPCQCLAFSLYSPLLYFLPMLYIISQALGMLSNIICLVSFRQRPESSNVMGTTPGLFGSCFFLLPRVRQVLLRQPKCADPKKKMSHHHQCFVSSCCIVRMDQLGCANYLKKQKRFLSFSLPTTLVLSTIFKWYTCESSCCP